MSCLLLFNDTKKSYQKEQDSYLISPFCYTNFHHSFLFSSFYSHFSLFSPLVLPIFIPIVVPIFHNRNAHFPLYKCFLCHNIEQELLLKDIYLNDNPFDAVQCRAHQLKCNFLIWCLLNANQ